MEFMYYWGIWGLLLIAAEIFTGTFYMLLMGVPALLMCALLYFMPDVSFPVQAGIYAFITVDSLVVWRILSKHRTQSVSVIGQSAVEGVGRRCKVSESISSTNVGRVKFVTGFMGDKDWLASSEDDLQAGDTAEVTGLNGNILTVKKV